ncbi:MAG: hypothetical protein HQL78_07245 [Magnetococcales bacterium]|nr:hypothetical protein [Magnetococcales bacterium]
MPPRAGPAAALEPLGTRSDSRQPTYKLQGTIKWLVKKHTFNKKPVPPARGWRPQGVTGTRPDWMRSILTQGYRMVGTHFNVEMHSIEVVQDMLRRMCERNHSLETALKKI